MSDQEPDPEEEEEEEEPVNLIVWGSLLLGTILAILFGRFLLQLLMQAFRSILG